MSDATSAELIIRPYTAEYTAAIKSLHESALRATGAFAESGPWDVDLNNIDGVYTHNNGVFLTGWEADRLVAMGAIKKITPEVCELKRMRVDPDFQGRGYGKQMLIALETEAKRLCYKTIQLDTTVKQVVAQRLYEKFGYTEFKRETEGWPLETIFYSKAIS